MDQKYNTSFIPKKFLSEDVQSGSTSKYIKRRSIIGPGYFIAVLIFIATVGASVALFSYTRITERSIEKKTDELTTLMSEIKSEDLAEFVELERQMRHAKMLLDNHVAISEILHKLEEKTIRDVQYRAMDYRFGNGTPSISLRGETKALANVALQLKEFESEQRAVSPALTSLERDSEEGIVLFDLNMNTLTELVSYAIAIKEGRHGKSPVPATPLPSIQTPTMTVSPAIP